MKRFISAILILIMVFSLVPCAVLPISADGATGKCGEGLYWDYNENTLTLTISGTGGMFDYSNVSWFWWSEEPVPWISWSGEIETVVFERGVTGIGGYSFFECENIMNVIFPDTLSTIGKSAFEGCKRLTKVILPDSVTAIGARAFQECECLAEVRLSENLSEISEGAFWSCRSLVSLVVPDSVSVINMNAFTDCNGLKSVLLGKGVKSICSRAFICCSNLDAIYFKGDMPEVQRDSEFSVFDDCTTLYYLEESDGWNEPQIGNPIALWDANTHIHLYSTEMVGFPCIEYFTRYTCICGYSFDGEHRVGLNHIYNDDISDLSPVSLCRRCGVIYPVDGGNIYFEKASGTIVYCDDSIVSLSVPESIEGVPVVCLGWGLGTSFESQLKSLVIPDTVTVVDASLCVFKKLESITVSEKNPKFCTIDGVLFNKDATSVFCYPPGKSGESYVLPESTVHIASNAFSANESLKEVIFQHNVKTIGESAFFECNNLKKVLFTGDAPSIGEYAFYTLDFTLENWWEPQNWIILPSLKCYYVEGKNGWTTPTWNGYPTATWDPHTHSYTAVVTAPTCTEQGYTTHTCVCGDSYVDTYVDALGHDWNDGAITTPATETEDGVKTYTCTRCGATKTEVIPATGEETCKHGHAHPEQKAATCTEPGYDRMICDDCGKVIAEELIPALGHDYKDGICTLCGAEDPDYQPVVFNDVPEKAWYAEAVNYAVKNKLMNGVGNNNFAPDDSMTRAMLVTVLWRYAGEPAEGKNTFTDVAEGQWYTDAVAWASENGIVGGVGNNKFDPDGNITREQMAAILYRYAQKNDFDTSRRGDLSSFPDEAKVSSYAADAIAWAVGEGIINGSDGKLMPQGNATRAQVSAILMRFIQNIAEK